MEFFRIERLKWALVQGPLPSPETAKYLAAQGALWSLIVIPRPAEGPTDWPFLTYPVLSLVGVYYCYRRHGGASGVRFAERYLAVGWVVGIRVAAALILLLIGGVGVLLFANIIDSDFLDSDAVGNALDIGMLVVIALVYWRMGVHRAGVHQLTVESRGL